MRRGYTKTRVIFFNAPSAAHWGRPTPSRRRLHLVLCGLLVVGVVSLILAIRVFNDYTFLAGSPRWTNGQRIRLTAVQSGDGLKVTWFRALNTRARLDQALWTTSKDPLMLEADVSNRSYDVTKSPTAQLMMALSRDIKSDLSVEEWLDTVIASEAGGIKLNFMTPDSLELCLKLLWLRRESLWQVPVWLGVSVVTGPGAEGPVMDAGWVTRVVNATYPRAQLVMGWSEPCCGEAPGRFGHGSMETMLKVTRRTTMPIIISARVTQAVSQWRHLRWLLESSDRLALLLWSPEEDKAWKHNATYYDLLTIRNDWSKRRVFYNLPDWRLREFRALCETAQSPLHYFNVHDRDAARVTWAHGVNSEAALGQAQREGSLMVEADVSLDPGVGAVMSHRGTHRHRNTSLTLAQWLDLVLVIRDKAIKLDLKSSEVIIPALKELATQRELIHRPVWVNADVVRGPNALYDPTNTTLFLKAVAAIFPEVTLSLGWTSGSADGGDSETYSWEMVEKMEKVARKVHQPVSFAVRAVLARRSWDKLDWLLHQSRAYTLTLFASATEGDRVAKKDLDFIRHQSESSRVYYDVPEEAMPDL